MNVYDFADIIGAQLVVRHRANFPHAASRWYAQFESYEVAEKGKIVDSTASGATPDEAICNYVVFLRGKKLTRGYGQNQVVFNVPEKLSVDF